MLLNLKLGTQILKIVKQQYLRNPLSTKIKFVVFNLIALGDINVPLQLNDIKSLNLQSYPNVIPHNFIEYFMNQSEILDVIKQMEEDCKFISDITEVSLTSKVVEYQMMPNHKHLLTEHLNTRSMQQIPLKIQPKDPPDSPKEIKYFKSEFCIRSTNPQMDSRRKQLFQPHRGISQRYYSESQRRSNLKSALKNKRNHSLFRAQKSVRFRIDNHQKF
ncbi:unnamed protein product (macronuclear) [Paramecium tetraurelia]|uniref:Uncharacterized protein n=1 Tax=Paramecium tetraurelia TaxID=5888 RepID=A0C583_PARTE|nr:uncharacterized protein GSPATT00006449001 [Paramecium tetraurelia]CAK65950.1 unnamed protein product [Paramecium tetraurelia]|eukprot:XP_001433347.1 hypothetical protein (macronuclear) [Paramecium tetraurelia strain d4-2]